MSHDFTPRQPLCPGWLLLLQAYNPLIANDPSRTPRADSQWPILGHMPTPGPITLARGRDSLELGVESGDKLYELRVEEGDSPKKIGVPHSK